MTTTRRDFVKMAAVAAAAMGVGVPAWASSGGQSSPFEKNPKRLTAKRWAMVVDTRKFTTEEDFARCIEACHSTHNVPDIDSKQRIKWIWTDEFDATFPGQENPYQAEKVMGKDYLLLCNHCENPPCVRVCPTKATFQREDGIVLMDFHRCIGCRYCMAGCPYGARSFNFMDPRPFIKELNMQWPTRTKGVVEKCNFCSERLAVGKMPACVEASQGGLIFGDLADRNSEVNKVLKGNYTIRRKPELGTSPSVFYII